MYWKRMKWHCHVSTTKWKQCELKSKDTDSIWLVMKWRIFQARFTHSPIQTFIHTHKRRQKKERTISQQIADAKESKPVKSIAHFDTLKRWFLTPISFCHFHFRYERNMEKTHTHDRHTLWFCGCLGSVLFYRRSHCSSH